MTENQTPNFTDLVPVSKWNSVNPWPSVGSIRQLIFFNTDGFADRVIVRIGKRLYLSISAFWQWIEDTNQKVRA